VTLLLAVAGGCSVLFSVLVLPGLIAAAKDLVKDEFVEGLPRLSELLLRAAANRYPTPHRERFAEEFQANLEHDFSSRRLSGLACALFTYSVAPRRARALLERDALAPATHVDAAVGSPEAVPQHMRPASSFATVQLTPIPGGRRLYALECVGTLRLLGRASRTATAEGGGRAWQFTYRGMWQRVIQAADAAGSVVGEYTARERQLGGMLQWFGRELALRPDSLSGDRYALLENDRRIATIENRGWGKRPVNIRVDGTADIGRGFCSSRSSPSARLRRARPR
jgi:hypothetical protein